MDRRSVVLVIILIPLTILPVVAVASAATNIGMLRVASFQCPREVPPSATFPVTLDVEYALQGLPDSATIRGAIYAGDVNSTSPLWQSGPTSVSNGGDELWNTTLTAPPSEGSFNLSAYAFYLDNGTWNYFNNPVNGPGVSQATVKVGKTATLDISLGAPGVGVTVNGMSEQTSSNGHASFTVAVATTPSVSVPTQVQLQNSTRLLFTQWSDGVSQSQRKVLIDGDINLTASYRIQYLLTLNSGSTSEVWYDKGANATINAPTSPSPPWPLNLLGVTQTFRGWAGDIQSTSPQLNVTMDSPKTITADMTTDYTPLALPVIVILGMVTAIVSFIVVRRRSSEAMAETVQAPIEEPVVETTSSACPNCGQTTEPEWAHCIKCGTKLNAPGPRTDNAPA